MSIFSNRPALRWLVPAAAAVTVIGGGAAIGTFAASADPALPARSAAQLLVDLQTARLDGMSGTMVQRADLGLPALPALGGNGVADLTALVSGTHTLRVWYAGQEQQRVALQGTLGETDVIHNGKDVWVWASERNEAMHSVLREEAKAGRDAGPTGLPITPQQAAERALSAINPSTEVTVGRSTRVAGRSVYELVLGPRDRDSLVGQIRIAIDAKQHVPLRFEVFARGSKNAAYQVAFTQVDFSRPDPAQFAFNPPPGAKVTQPDAAGPGPSRHGTRPDAAQQDARPTVVGEGWTTVLTARVDELAGGRPGATTGGTDASGTAAGAQLTGMLNGLPTVKGSWGSGKLLSTKLVTALLTDDGRLLVGAVTPDRLYEVARNGK